MREMNLLFDPLLRVQTNRELLSMSLPALLAALARDDVQQVVGLQRHQEDALHVFLCYLAGAVLARWNDAEPPRDEEYWRCGLRTLAGAVGDDAWSLVVADPSRPAFLQPPLPKADHDRLRLTADTPDALDLLLTAKNHDLKANRAVGAEPDQWIYALISLQTMSGYYGRGNPGISRMNGGYGSRPIVELVRSQRPGCRWLDAVRRLLGHRREILDAGFGYQDRGLVLVWIEPWDGKSSLALSQLDPFYVEICRRVRLRTRGFNLVADAVPSESNRIAAKELKGVVGDAWLPVDLKKSDAGKTAGDKALTVPPGGPTAELLRRLIFADEVKLSALQRSASGWKDDVSLIVSVLVRGQGTTDGFHERCIPIPLAAQPRVFGPPERRDPFAALSRTGIEYAGKMQHRVLKPAILVYLSVAVEKARSDRESIQAWWKRFSGRFEELWSEAFFPWLWSTPEPFDDKIVLVDWAVRLRGHALTVLREAEQALPRRVGYKYRALVEAERRFWAALYAKNNFPFLKEEKGESGND